MTEHNRLEACTVSRNRLRAYDVWEKYGMDIEFTEEYNKTNVYKHNSKMYYSAE